MKKPSLQTIFSLILLSVFINISSQSKTSKKSITWKKDFKLSKQDFKGEVDTNSMNAAQTGANIIIVPYAKKSGKYLYRVFAKFYKYKSWINTDSKIILNHEQLHFDIAELYARKMRREIHKIRLSKKEVEEFDYRRIHKKFFKEYIAFQRKYDLETDFSRKLSIQKKWETSVNKQLSELEKFTLE